MQIKKEEIKERILEVASLEFVKKGYENASLRTIAKKANTSLGNIYHYYPSKEAILDALLEPEVEALKFFLEEHVTASIHIHNREEIDNILDEVDIEGTEMKVLLSREFVIFIQTEVPKYVAYREKLLALFRKHVAWHMSVKEDNHFIVIISNMMIDCIIHYVKCDYHINKKKNDFVQMFKMMCAGVIMNEETDSSFKIEDDETKNIK